MATDQWLYEMIAEREKLIKARNEIDDYNGYDDFYRRENERKIATAKRAIADIEARMIALVQHDYPECLVPTNMEATISNVMATVPAPEPDMKMWMVNPGRA